MGLLSYLENHEEGLIKLTQGLVKIESVSGNEEKIRDFIKKFLGNHQVKAKTRK